MNAKWRAECRLCAALGECENAIEIQKGDYISRRLQWNILVAKQSNLRHFNWLSCGMPGGDQSASVDMRLELRARTRSQSAIANRSVTGCNAKIANTFGRLRCIGITLDNAQCSLNRLFRADCQRLENRIEQSSKQRRLPNNIWYSNISIPFPIE